MRLIVSVAAGLLAVLAGPGATARAQVIVGSGWPAGDYLRGVGAAAIGMSVYNLNTAVAERINVGTYILWNEYLYNAAKNENRENAKHRAAVREQRRKNKEAIEKRIRDNPNGFDVTNGDALNALMEEMIGPKARVHESTLRHSRVDLDRDTIRGIPFVYAADGVRFSMQRLLIKGEKNWPVGLRGQQLERERRVYYEAMEAILEQQVHRKLQRETILKLESALNDLRGRLNQVVTPDRDTVYMEAKKFLDQLERTKEMIKHQSVEKILAEIEDYSGTTLYDLLVFMDTWKLRFGSSDIGAERKLLNDLYVAMIQQRDQILDPDNRPEK